MIFKYYSHVLYLILVRSKLGNKKYENQLINGTELCITTE
jgi:hypothetical protein